MGAQFWPPFSFQQELQNMKLIRLDQVRITPDRQRQTFNSQSLEALADSIQRLGLFHAILLEPDGCTLRAGERRWRALSTLSTPYVHDGQTIPPGFVPFTTTADLTESELFEIELEENIQRQDLTWQERTAAYARLFELQQRVLGDKPLTVAEFGRILHPEAPLRAAKAATPHLHIAKHLDDPDVAAAKTMKEAENIIRRKNESILRMELLQRTGALPTKHRLVNESAFDFLPSLPNNSVDIIITDPPYGIDMDQMSTQSGSSSGLTHAYRDDQDYAAKCVELLAQEGARVGKASCVCYMFCDLRLWPTWAKLFEAADWYVWPFPVIWNKAPTGSLLGSANGPRHCYEAILIAIRGKRQVNFVGEDVISITGPQANKQHPAEKPVALYEKLLAWSAAPGDTVLDPFCGCGPVLPAAEAHGCFAIASELDASHYAVAATRLQSLGKEIL
jgi:site-specific DNA-methyltransferase (adenine-specific)